MDEMLDDITRVWAGEERGYAGAIGPDVSSDPPSLIVGGSVDASFERAAKYGDGWTQGGSGASQFGADISNLDDAWKKAGREGQPRTLALGYFCLGPDAQANVESYVSQYYAWLGDDAVQGIIAGAPKDADSVKAFLKAYEEWNCDELILFPCSPDTEQVSLLAEAAGL